MFKNIMAKASKLFMLVCTLVAAVFMMAVNCFAAGVDDLFAAVNITGLATNITTLLIAGVGIAVLYAGYKHVVKPLRRI